MTDAHATPRLLLRVTEAAETLAISRTALYDLLRRDEIRAIHIGRSIRFSAAALEAYVARCMADATVQTCPSVGTVQPVEPLQPESATKKQVPHAR